MTGRDHEIRDAAVRIDDVVERLFEREPWLAAELSDALLDLMPDVVDRHMAVVMARSNRVDVLF